MGMNRVSRNGVRHGSSPLAGIGHGQPWSGGDDVPTLHGLAVHCRRWEIQADFGPFLAFLDANEDAVANDDQALVVLLHWVWIWIHGKEL